MDEVRRFLASQGLPARDAHELPSSPTRFADGAQYRLEIPSVEGPRALLAALEEAERLGVPFHRVSQGSGIMMLTDAEIREMARLGREAAIEVSLFVGPRAGWDTGAQVVSTAGRNLGARLRGMDQVVFAAEDVRRACALGIRSVLVADEGLLWLLSEMKRAGALPADLVLKISVQMGAANPISVRWMEQLGATTYNVPTDLSLAHLAALRQTCAIPFDVYVEAPDDFGGFVRHYETPEIVRVAAPVYVKLGLRNAPNIYPSGVHLEATAVALVRERVHRTALVLDIMRRYQPEARMSGRGPRDLGIPVIA
jgi:Peptidase family U32